jgi:GNAT superfamily N-acetyltransferase
VTGREEVAVREATVEELPDVLNVIDGAALRADAGRLRTGIDNGEVLVAVAGGERVLGVLVLDGEEILTVAVRRRRRDQGIGTALVEAAAERRGRLVAAFDPRVRRFWAGLGFAIAPAVDDSGGTHRSGRLRGVREE